MITGSLLANVAITAGQMLISVGLNWTIRALICRDEHHAQSAARPSMSPTAPIPPAVSPPALVATAGAIAYDNTHGEASKYWQRVYVLSH